MRKNSRIPYLLVSWSVGLLVFVGCSNSVETNINTCQIDRDCSAGLSCQSGLCRSAEDQSVVSVCEVDQDCLSGQWCQSGICMGDAVDGELPVANDCGVTSDCPINQYCNPAVGQCQNLLETWCRESQQCDPATPICTASDRSQTGQCVECQTAAECITGYCSAAGLCETNPDGNYGGDNSSGSNEDSDGTDMAVLIITTMVGPATTHVRSCWYGDGQCGETLSPSRPRLYCEFGVF